MKQCKLILLLLCSILAEAQTQLPDGFITQQIAAGLDPTAIALAPDGRIFIAIKSGQIAIVENGELLQHPFLTIDVDNSNERGLSGIAFDPDFEFNNYIYVFYTVPAQNRNRVSRFTANGNFAVPGSETILLDLDVMPGNIHNAGAMQFGKDGKLYISTGDGAQASNAQSMQNLLGKILRINKDGSIPEDNPFYASTQDNNRAIYAIGFRNPFTMDIHPHSGDIIIGDVGEGTWEEINLVHAGGNYGWPQIEGKRTTQTPPANYQDPIYAYNHSEGCAITGVAFYHPQMLNFPLQFQDKILFADYCSGFIKTFDQENNVTENFASGINRPIAIRTAPDGSVYYLARAGMGGGSPQDNTSSTNGSLWQIKYTGSGEPFITSQPQDVRAVIGESVNFTVNALGLQPLQYQWQRDETDIEGANNPTFQIESVSLTDHQKSFRCIISNELGEVISDAAQLEVIDNTRPEPEILLPAQDALYRAGEMLYFEGSATDAEDGDLPASALSWRINFHHDDHYHPAMPDLAGTFSGTYEIPRIGELSDNVWYRVFLTATDADGFSKTVFRDVHPVKTNITVNSEPSGVLINVDGQLMQTPASISSVVGITRTFEALAGFEIDNKLYVFDSWSNGSTTRLLQYNA
ncbi:MAG TPA: PQQ-dependent sugar dehydrogenase, partial [Cyclobacteriaceae bacterium]|nr:PQQ-dependent sugar dehydrogenase [Cyclobacteriaceae bacterium]